MKNPLVVFTGLALASLAALVAVTMQRSGEAPSEGGKLAVTEAATAQKSAEKAEVTEAKPAAEPAKQPEQKPTEAQVEPKVETKVAEIEKKTEPALAENRPKSVENEPKSVDAEKRPEPAKPEFDTVRIEADGSAIVAGQAKPGAEVTLKLNGEAIGKGVANAEGAWVVVPHAPLPKGTHEITAEQKVAEASAPVMSDQSIAVAVPEDGKKQPMVAVLEPGEATKVLQKAEPQTGQQTAAAEPSSPEAKAEAKPEVSEPQSGQQTAAVEPSPPEAKPEAKPEVTEPAERTVTEPASQEPTAQPIPEPLPEETKQASLPEPEEVAPPPKNEPAAMPPEPIMVPLSLDVVDYNDRGDIIFSGRATSGTAVRLYVDNQPVGDAITDSNGNWSFTGSDLIAPGTHALRADQIDAAGKVVARIELPFLREDSKRVATLTESDKAAKPPAEVKVEPPAEAKVEPPATEPPAETKVETPASEPTTEAQTPAPEQPAEEKSKQAEAGLQPEPKSTEQKGAEQVLPPKPEPEQQAESEPKVAELPPKPEAEAADAAPEPEPPAEAAGENKKVEFETAAKAAAAAAAEADMGSAVKPRIGRVVIQPRNNLWKLSRVIYGRGVHYTVIYQANKGQIRNPDLIYPGQIFTIPNASPPEAIDPKRKLPLTAAEGGGTVE